ncbi:MAG TPA: ABC transporter ATP-binding protein [Aquiluna sp.]
MNHVIEVKDLTRSYRGVTAVDNVSLTIEENGIYGLLGRNGAGKTTLMRLIAGHEFATFGQISIYDQNPVENSAVLANLAFIRESMRYPENFKIEHVVKAAEASFANWDGEFAQDLIETFRIPHKRQIRKLSRGQLSAVGVVVGLASRAPITILDEPYIGMDAVARKQFYELLLADYIENPRTIVLSTHLIDEVADLLEHVFVIDQGKITLDAKVEDLRGAAAIIEGSSDTIEPIAAGFEILESQTIGSQRRIVAQGLSETDFAELQKLGLVVKPASLQQLIVSKTKLDTNQEASITL